TTRSGVPAGNVFSVGTTTITYTATDAAGNSALATQTVTVNDTTPPQLAAPADLTRSATGVTTFIAETDLGVATASDNCGAAAVTRAGLPTGDLYAHGTTLITYTASDAVGNTATATQTITLSASTASVCALVRAAVSDAGIAKSLCAKLDAAAASRARGNMAAHDNQLDAFANEVNAQRTKAISDASATTLIRLAGTL